MKIPLFDIDGTLFKTGNRISKDSFTYAIKNVYGIDANQDEINPEGMVDNQIIVDVLKLHGLTQTQVEEKLKDQTEAMTKYCQEHINDMSLEVLPGVRELLSKLKELDAPMGLLTGNVEGMAWTKMESTGLRDYFEFGAFGNMVFKRADLVEIARKNAEQTLGKPVKTNDLIIIGDTPKDIQCARDAGIEVIAVSTGIYPFEELVDEKPDLAVHSLEEKSVFEFILN